MFTYFTPENAPESSKLQLETMQKNIGMIPNLHRVLAVSPLTLNIYNSAFNGFLTQSIFTPVEQQVVFMTANFENNCHYCVPGHTSMMKHAGMPDDIIAALREGTPMADSKLEALRQYAKALLDNRGHISDDQLNAFLSAGYTQAHAIEVLTGLAAKLISNFTNAIAKTETDDAFKSQAWVHPSDR